MLQSYQCWVAGVLQINGEAPVHRFMSVDSWSPPHICTRYNILHLSKWQFHPPECLSPKFLGHPWFFFFFFLILLLIHVSSTLEKSAESKSQQPFVLAPITSNLDYHNLHFTDLLTFTLALSNVSSTPQPEWNFYFIVLNFLLRYNRHITLYNFKVYNMLIQYIYRL